MLRVRQSSGEREKCSEQGKNECSGLEVREHSMLECWKKLHGGDIMEEEE